MSDFECTLCGCCCFSSAEDYIPVFACDEARMDSRARTLTHEVSGRRVMRFVHGRCEALRFEAGRFSCSIYDMRPDACRWLVPSSGACREQIRDKRDIALGFATPSSLVSLRRRSA